MKASSGVLLGLLIVMAPTPARAQIPGTELTQVLVSRPALESLLTRLDQAAQSSQFSAPVRDRVRRQAQLVRARLADGDFHVGDRILLVVEGEPTLTDTFTVQAERQVIFPTIGAIPLQGILRFELNDYIRDRLGQFLRNPVVRARSLIRVVIKGAVGRQGFYTVPVDIPIDAVFALAGGPGPGADLDKMRLSRGQEILFEGEDLQQLITQGTTIDALGIQAGDQFFIGDKPIAVPAQQRVQTLQYLLALPFTIFALIKLFGL